MKNKRCIVKRKGFGKWLLAVKIFYAAGICCFGLFHDFAALFAGAVGCFLLLWHFRIFGRIRVTTSWMFIAILAAQLFSVCTCFYGAIW